MTRRRPQDKESGEVRKMRLVNQWYTNNTNIRGDRCRTKQFTLTNKHSHLMIYWLQFSVDREIIIIESNINVNRKFKYRRGSC